MVLYVPKDRKEVNSPVSLNIQQANTGFEESRQANLSSEDYKLLQHQKAIELFNEKKQVDAKLRNITVELQNEKERLNAQNTGNITEQKLREDPRYNSLFNEKEQLTATSQNLIQGINKASQQAVGSNQNRESDFTSIGFDNAMNQTSTNNPTAPSIVSPDDRTNLKNTVSDPNLDPSKLFNNLAKPKYGYLTPSGNYVGASRNGESIDPRSEEGRIIQDQYQTQFERRALNQAQKERFNAITRGDATLDETLFKGNTSTFSGSGGDRELSKLFLEERGLSLDTPMNEMSIGAKKKRIGMEDITYTKERSFGENTWIQRPESQRNVESRAKTIMTDQILNMGQREYETGRGTELATGEVKYPTTLTNAEIKLVQGAVDKYSPRGDSVTVEIRDGNNNVIETKQVGISGGGVELANVIKDAKDSGYSDVRISEGVGRNEMQNFPQPQTQSFEPQSSGGFTMSNLSLLPTAYAEPQNADPELFDVNRPVTLTQFAQQAVENATPEERLDAFLNYGKDQGIDQIIVTDSSGTQTLVPIDTAKESIITTANEKGLEDLEYNTGNIQYEAYLDARKGMENFIADAQKAGYNEISMVNQDGKQVNVPIDDKLLGKMIKQYNAGSLEYDLPFRDMGIENVLSYDEWRGRTDELIKQGEVDKNNPINLFAGATRDGLMLAGSINNLVNMASYEGEKAMRENPVFQDIRKTLFGAEVVVNDQPLVRKPDVRISESPISAGAGEFLLSGVLPTAQYAVSQKSSFNTQQYQQAIGDLDGVSQRFSEGIAREGGLTTAGSLVGFVTAGSKMTGLTGAKVTVPTLVKQSNQLSRFQTIQRTLGKADDEIFTADGLMKQDQTLWRGITFRDKPLIGIATGGNKIEFTIGTPKAENIGLEKLAPEAGFEVSSTNKVTQKLLLDPNTEAYLTRMNPKFDNEYFSTLRSIKREAELADNIPQNIIKPQRNDFGDQPQRGVDRAITTTAIQTIVKFQGLKHSLQQLTKGEKVPRLGALKGSPIENLYYTERFTFGDMDFLVKKQAGESFARILSYDLKDVVARTSDNKLIPVAHYGDTSSSVMLSDARSNVFYHGSTVDNIKQISQYGYDFSQAGTSTLQGFLAKGMGQARAEQLLRRLNPEGFYMTPNADLAQYFATKASDGAGGTIASVELKPWLKILNTNELSAGTRKMITEQMMDWSKVSDKTTMISEYRKAVIKYAKAEKYEGVTSDINILGKTEKETVIFSNDSILGVNRKWINEKDTKYFIDYDPTRPLTPDTKLVEFVQRGNMGEVTPIGSEAGRSVFGTKYPKKVNTLSGTADMPQVKGLKMESFMDQHLTRIASSSITRSVRIGGDEVYRLLPPEHRIKDLVRKYMNNEVLIRDLRATENASGISSKRKAQFQNMASELESINKLQRARNEAMGINYDEMIDFMRQEKTTADFTGSTGTGLGNVGSVVGGTSSGAGGLIKTGVTGNEPELGKYQFSNMSMEEVEQTFGLGGGTPLYKASSAEVQARGYEQDIYEGTNYVKANDKLFKNPDIVKGWYDPEFPSARFINTGIKWEGQADDVIDPMGDYIGKTDSHETIHFVIDRDVYNEMDMGATAYLARQGQLNKAQQGYDNFVYGGKTGDLEFKGRMTEQLVGSDLKELPKVIDMMDTVWSGYQIPKSFVSVYDDLKNKPPITKESVRNPDEWVEQVQWQRYDEAMDARVKKIDDTIDDDISKNISTSPVIQRSTIPSPVVSPLKTTPFTSSMIRSVSVTRSTLPTSGVSAFVGSSSLRNVPSGIIKTSKLLGGSQISVSNPSSKITSSVSPSNIPISNISTMSPVSSVPSTVASTITSPLTPSTYPSLLGGGGGGLPAPLFSLLPSKNKKDKKKKPKKTKSKKISWDVPDWYGGYYSPYEYIVFTGKAPKKVRNTRQ